MLDMITKNVYVDGGVLYTKTLLNVHQRFRNIVYSACNNGTGNTVASTYSPAYGDQVRAELETLQNSIKALKAPK